MEINRARHLCVTEGEKIRGVVTIRDLVNCFVHAETGPIRDLENVYRPLSVLMAPRPETVDSKTSLFNAAQRMAQRSIGALLVTENEEVVGILTEIDIVRKVIAYNLDPRPIHVGSLMNHPVVDIDINRTIYDANNLMAEKRIRHLVVTENKRMEGILSVRDLIRMISIRDRPRYVAQKRTKQPPSQ